ncbi:MAG: thioredoxin [Lachnospiraceae bacterium]|nr:thioredoxin [Lachnospiraceae bacterium]
MNYYKKTTLIRNIILFVSLAMIAAGILTGGPFDVKSKAVMICLECMGIG